MMTTTRPRSKPIFGALAVSTLLGLGAPARLTNMPNMRRAETPGTQRGAVGPLQMMKQSLSLSDEQARKLEPVFKEQQDKLNALRRDSSLSRKDRVARLREIQQGTDATIKAQLRAQPAEKWQQVSAHPGQVVPQQEPDAARGS